MIVETNIRQQCDKRQKKLPLATEGRQTADSYLLQSFTAGGRGDEAST